MKTAMKTALCVLVQRDRRVVVVTYRLTLISLFPSLLSYRPTVSSTNSDSSTKRAFQTLPRHLRRRAASHNARRVPGRLRAKAASEARPSLLRLSQTSTGC